MMGDLKPDLSLPIQAKVIIVVGIVVLSFLAGFKVSSALSEAEIKTMENAHLTALNAAKDQALTEHMLARAAERKAAESIANAASNFEKVRQNEKDIADRTITDLLNDNARLRVSVRSRPATGTVPGTAAGAGSCDDRSEATLTGSVAARLARRYDDYNALVGVLELCQATVRADRAMTK